MSIRDDLRRKQVGNLGEILAAERLAAAGFVRIENLNAIRRNSVFADIIAERMGQGYAISVKARNRLQKNGKVNASYNLLKTAAQRQSLDLIISDPSIIPAWVAIVIDADESVYDAYFGLVSDLHNRYSIPMYSKNCAMYEALALKLSDHRISPLLSNNVKV